jgi:ribosomal protein S18 acetylase RimI-like enzyme
MNPLDITITEVYPEQAPMELLLLADPSTKMIEQYLNKSNILCAFFNSEIIGVIVLYPILDSIMEIKNLAVNLNYKNQGMGKQLIQSGEDFAKSNGYNILRICTGNTSLQQLALYQKKGFHIKGKIENYFLNHYPYPIIENGELCKDLIILEKEINKSLIFSVMP